MSVRVSWFDLAHTIVHYELEENWTWEEFYPALEQALDMERTVSHRVDVIIELDPLRTLPPNLITNILAIARNQPDNLGLSVFVTEQSLLKSLHKVAAQLSPMVREGYVFVTTIEEALAVIEQKRTL